MKDMNFKQACEQASKGEMIAREGWSSCSRSFVFERPSDVLKMDFIPKVKSLPESVKEFLTEQYSDIEFTAYLCMWDESHILDEGKIVNGWNPSETDKIAIDWYVKK